jgi:hypothetical protein
VIVWRLSPGFRDRRGCRKGKRLARFGKRLDGRPAFFIRAAKPINEATRKGDSFESLPKANRRMVSGNRILTYVHVDLSGFDYARMAAISGWMPMTFITRVKL